MFLQFFFCLVSILLHFFLALKQAQARPWCFGLVYLRPGINVPPRGLYLPYVSFCVVRVAEGRLSFTIFIYLEINEVPPSPETISTVIEDAHQRSGVGRAGCVFPRISEVCIRPAWAG